jgi:hypothetical protein
MFFAPIHSWATINDRFPFVGYSHLKSTRELEQISFLSLGLWFPELFLNPAWAIQQKATMDQSFDKKAHPDEQKGFVCFAHRPRQLSVYASIQQAAVNVKRIKPVLNG